MVELFLSSLSLMLEEHVKLNVREKSGEWEGEGKQRGREMGESVSRDGKSVKKGGKRGRALLGRDA